MSRIKKTLMHPKEDPEKRATFCQKLKEYEDENRKITFLDESGFAHHQPRTHGYFLKGQVAMENTIGAPM